MANSVSKKSLWESAAKAGLVLGVVSSAYMLVSNFLTPTSENVSLYMLIVVIGLILWALKFFACIWLMKRYMRKLCSDFSGVTNSDTFKFGMFTALLSALIYSAFFLAYHTILFPDALTATLDSTLQMYSSMLDSNSMSAIDSMKNNLPQTLFFSNFFYCFIFGTVISFLLSRNIPSRNPFEDENV